MEVLDLLTDEDINLIDKYISTYGGNFGDSLEYHADTKHLLRFWNGAKSGFLSTLMGDQLILERHINISTPESIIWKRMSEIMGDELEEFINNYLKWTRSLPWEIGDLANELVCYSTLASNTYKGESFELTIPGKKHPLQVNEGCKAIKILGKIAKAFSIDGFEEFRLKHSRVLNQKKFEGTLCLSIHPLDYMTMSDNDCDWDSCMSWRKPGEVRAGTVEMMNSPCVIVAYLKAEEDMQLIKSYKYKWNNKRWRQLFVVTPDLITGIKGYPFYDKILEKETFKWLMELVNTNCPWCHYEGPIEYDADESFEIFGKRIQIDYQFNVMYNDFFSDHRGYFSPNILEKVDKYNIYHLSVSGETLCLLCGEPAYDPDEWNSEHFICPDCAGESKCSHCGDYYDTDDLIEMDNGDFICPNCADYYTRTCARCGIVHYREDGDSVFMSENEEINTSEVFYLCDDCFDKSSEDNKFGPIRVIRRTGLWFNPDRNAIDINELTAEGFHAFGYWGETIEKMRSMV